MNKGLNGFPSLIIAPSVIKVINYLGATQTVSALADLNTMSVTFIPKYSGYYAYSLSLAVGKATTGTMHIYLTDGANVAKFHIYLSLSNGFGANFSALWHEYLQAGIQVTRKLRGNCDAGSMTLNPAAGTLQFTTLFVGEYEG
jgi:hypothetical protein